MLTDISFFVGDINIPNTSKPEVNQSVNMFIGKYETELLIQMFGADLYQSYVADPTTPRFQLLLKGDPDLNWRGLTYTINDVPYSLIAYYIYWWWIKDKYIWNSGVGTIRTKPNQAEIMSPALKMVEAWNTFSDQVAEFICYMTENSDVFPEWQPYNMWHFNKVNDFDI